MARISYNSDPSPASLWAMATVWITSNYRGLTTQSTWNTRQSKGISIKSPNKHVRHAQSRATCHTHGFTKQTKNPITCDMPHRWAKSNTNTKTNPFYLTKTSCRLFALTAEIVFAASFDYQTSSYFCLINLLLRVGAIHIWRWWCYCLFVTHSISPCIFSVPWFTWLL